MTDTTKPNNATDGGLHPITCSASSIIADLIQAMPESVRDATDEELLEGFLDMDAEQEVRDTAQVILEARKYLRESQQVESVLAAIRACPDTAQLKHLPYGGYVVDDGGGQLGSGVTPADAWMDAAISPQNA